ncbi:MAG: elongation factor G [Armatimonadetes bacterium]|nr:elongation factor G [Armatimonadota bacterium]
MKRFKADAVRNVALAGHGGTGKTSLVEAMLFDAGAIDRLGRVDAGNATTDFDPDEVRRHMSVNVALGPLEWREHKVNLIDTPGYADFIGEVASGQRVAEAVVLVVSAPAGVEVGTEAAWELADRRQLPRLVFVNKMDRENADFSRCVDSLRAAFGNKCVAIQVPLGAEANFRGVVDVLHQVAFIGTGRDARQTEVPAELADEVERAREQLMESAAEADDELLEKYLGGEPLSDEELMRGLVAGVKAGSVVPVLCGSATENLGAQPLLDALVQFVPSPVEAGAVRGETGGVRQPSDSAPLSALVFKTITDPYVGKLTYFRVYSGVLRSGSEVANTRKEQNERIGQLYVMRGKSSEAVSEIPAGDIGAVAKLAVTSTGDTLADATQPIVYPGIEFPQPTYSAAITAQTKADEDKMGPALQRLAEEDPTFQYRRDAETGQTVISGQGDTHLDIIVERLRRLGANVQLQGLKVPYRETLTATVRVQGRHKKQTGGRGQYGDCWVKFEPLPRGTGYEFVDAIVGGAIPRQYIPAVDKGIQEATEHGILAGYRVVDIRATCDDGSFHAVDSSELAFKLAGSLAFRNAMEKDAPVLLEPILDVEITVPEQYMGDVIGDLNTKRGRIQGMEPVGGGKQLIRAQVPMAEMLRYAIDLRSIARGRGTFRTSFSHYEEVPAHTAQQIIEKAKKEREEAHG